MALMSEWKSCVVTLSETKGVARNLLEGSRGRKSPGDPGAEPRWEFETKPQKVETSMDLDSTEMQYKYETYQYQCVTSFM